MATITELVVRHFLKTLMNHGWASLRFSRLPELDYANLLD
jgi:hypothetical protein